MIVIILSSKRSKKILGQLNNYYFINYLESHKNDGRIICFQMFHYLPK